MRDHVKGKRNSEFVASALEKVPQAIRGNSRIKSYIAERNDDGVKLKEIRNLFNLALSNFIKASSHSVPEWCEFLLNWIVNNSSKLMGKCHIYIPGFYAYLNENNLLPLRTFKARKIASSIPKDMGKENSQIIKVPTLKHFIYRFKKVYTIMNSKMDLSNIADIWNKIRSHSSQYHLILFSSTRRVESVSKDLLWICTGETLRYIESMEAQLSDSSEIN